VFCGHLFAFLFYWVLVFWLTKRQTKVHKTLVRKLKPNKTKRQTKVHKTLVRKL
jgi:hypothetical protein